MVHDEELNPTVLTATMKGDLGKKEAAKANALFSSVISDIAKGCVSAGAVMIGHIKANFTSGKDMLSVSCTTNDGNTRSRSEFSCNVGLYEATLNVIVYGVDYHEMEHIVERVLKTVPGSEFEILDSEHECHDPNCPHHHH